MTATLTLKRRFTATPARVYQAWTDPSHFAQWIGPVGVPCTLLGMDPTQGGAFHLDMHLAPDHTIHVAGRFTRLDPPSRIDLTWGAADGSVTTDVTILLHATDQGTEMEFLHHLPTADMVASHRDGWASAFDKLETFLRT
jgi:uncharacterized protein YndB with AHSA1/START domain